MKMGAGRGGPKREGGVERRYYVSGRALIGALLPAGPGLSHFDLVLFISARCCRRYTS